MALRGLLLFAGMLVCSSSSAGTVYFCEKADGTRAAQDHPCVDESATLKAAPLYEPPFARHIQNIAHDGVARIQERTRQSIQKINCDSHKDTFEREKESARLSTDPKIGARHVDRARASHDYLSDNCAGF